MFLILARSFILFLLFNVFCRSKVTGPFLSFLLPYFVYDVYAMYCSYCLKYKKKLDLLNTFSGFSNHHALLLFHHVGIILVAYPIVLDVMVRYYPLLLGMFGYITCF